MDQRRGMTREGGDTFSVVVGTIQGWPDITPAVRSLEIAAKRVNGEVIVVDGSGEPPRVLRSLR